MKYVRTVLSITPGIEEAPITLASIAFYLKKLYYYIIWQIYGRYEQNSKLNLKLYLVDFWLPLAERVSFPLYPSLPE